MLQQDKTLNCLCGFQPEISYSEENGLWVIRCPYPSDTLPRYVATGPTNDTAVRAWNAIIAAGMVEGSRQSATPMGRDPVLVSL